MGDPPDLIPRTTRLVGLWGLVDYLKPTGLTYTWLKGRAQAGVIPGLLIGRKWLFDTQAVEAVLIRMAAGQEQGQLPGPAGAGMNHACEE